MKLTATLLKFGEDSSPDAFGDVVRFLPDSLFSDEHQQVGLFVQHDTGKAAAGVAEELWVESDGRVRGRFALLDTTVGRDVAAELAAGVRWDISVGVRIEDFTEEELDAPEGWPYSWAPVRLSAVSADLVETTLCLRGRMPSARVDDIDLEEGTPA